jgi:hypothetical protein
LQNQPNQPSRSWIDADPYRPYARDGQFVPSRIQRATDPPPAAVVPGPQFAPPMDWLTGQPTFQEVSAVLSAHTRQVFPISEGGGAKVERLVDQGTNAKASIQSPPSPPPNTPTAFFRTEVSLFLLHLPVPIRSAFYLKNKFYN